MTATGASVYYVSCDPDRQGEGLGRHHGGGTGLAERPRGVWKLNLMIREGQRAQVQGFYEALGYECEPRILMARSCRSGLGTALIKSKPFARKYLVFRIAGTSHWPATANLCKRTDDTGH